jgi:hypothetical protein
MPAERPALLHTLLLQALLPYALLLLEQNARVYIAIRVPPSRSRRQALLSRLI